MVRMSNSVNRSFVIKAASYASSNVKYFSIFSRYIPTTGELKTTIIVVDVRLTMVIAVNSNLKFYDM